jgi:hypothetical protein
MPNPAFTITGTLTPAALISQPAFFPLGDFNLTLWGSWAGQIIPERSWDGTLWHPFTYADGSAMAWGAPMSTTMFDGDANVRWRLRALSLMTGNAVNWRFSR